MSKQTIPSSSDISMNERRDSEIQKQNLELANRQNEETSSLATGTKGNDDLNYIQDQETKELYSRARAQQDEIMLLREQVALASVKESQLLNEKYALEKKFSELRMALDEKQNEAITSASNELARRKTDLEENVKLIHELKTAEDEKYIFMSSLLGLLAEYRIWPRVTNASTLTNSIKHLHDQLQLKIRNSHAKMAELNSIMGNDASMEPFDKESPGYGGMNGQLAINPLSIHGFSPYTDGPNSNLHSYGQDNNMKRRSLMRNDGGRHFRNDNNLLQPSYESKRDVADPVHYNINDRNAVIMQPEERTNDNLYDSPARHEEFGPFGSEEEGPRIEGFQIIGDAKPGCRLLGCGYPVQGTSLCMFQWVRHYSDGTREYIEGATNPEYVVTADDVDKVIAVECIPMDDLGRQGELVRLFANDSNKIICDSDMQFKIDSYVSKGQADFNLLMLTDSSETWEPATLFVKRSSFQVKLARTQVTILAEKFSKDLSIIIPSGFSSQFVVTCANGSSHPFTTNDDISMRDMVVLTVRIFQSKAVDEKRKGKA